MQQRFFYPHNYSKKWYLSDQKKILFSQIGFSHPGPDPTSNWMSWEIFVLIKYLVFSIFSIQGRFDIAKKLIEAGADVNLISQVDPIKVGNF